MSQGILDGVWTGLAKGVAACERARDRIRVQMAPDPVTGEVRQSTMRLLADGFLSNLILLLRVGQWIVGSIFVLIWGAVVIFVGYLAWYYLG